MSTPRHRWPSGYHDVVFVDVMTHHLDDEAVRARIADGSFARDRTQVRGIAFAEADGKVVATPAEPPIPSCWSKAGPPGAWWPARHTATCAVQCTASAMSAAHRPGCSTASSSTRAQPGCNLPRGRQSRSPGQANTPRIGTIRRISLTEMRMSTVAKGTFTVKLAPLPFEGQAEASKLARMSIHKQITGDLVAATVGQMLSAMTETKGSAGYVAIERVEGTLHRRKGSFVLQHTGTMNRGAPSLSVTVVPDSGTGELEGLAGEFKIIIAEGKHSYEFAYTLPSS